MATVVGIHQPHYLPWLRYFDKIARSDVFIVLDNIQYSKNGWQNRNKIKGPDGTRLLTLPVVARLGEAINEVRIDYRQPWNRKHWGNIEQCYRAAPYFATYANELAALYRRRWDRLDRLNRYMLNLFLDLLEIETPIAYASDLNVKGAATDRLVNLIKAVGGEAYYSGAYALESYLDPEALEKAGIELRIQEWTTPVYPQLHGDFVPDLSIIDLLMNCGPDSRQVLLGESP